MIAEMEQELDHRRSLVVCKSIYCVPPTRVKPSKRGIGLPSIGVGFGPQIGSGMAVSLAQNWIRNRMLWPAAEERTTPPQGKRSRIWSLGLLVAAVSVDLWSGG